jgi:predicted transcriptional regulator
MVESIIMMNEDKEIVKILKWAGIVALIAVPVIVFFKNKKDKQSSNNIEDESNIYSSEFE